MCELSQSLLLRHKKIELVSEIVISRDVYLIAPSILSFPRYFEPTRRVVQEVKIVRVLSPQNEIKMDSRN